jgi:histidine ammonia-lyase
LAHPASVDSLPTSANQEDHVSMATFAARRLKDISENVVGILAVEWLAANQGLDFRAPLKTSIPLENAKAILRAKVAFYDKDRYFATDIEDAASMIQNEDLAHIMDESVLGF